MSAPNRPSSGDPGARTAWERLRGLLDGSWRGGPAEVRAALAGLGAAEKARVREESPWVQRILERSGAAADQARAIDALEPPLPVAVRWLAALQLLPQVSHARWAQLLAEAPPEALDALCAWAETDAALWALVQQHCPATILQVARQNRDAAAAAAALEDPVQLETLLSALGPAGFLAVAARGDAAAVDGAYRGLQARGRVRPLVEVLPKGAQLSAASRAGLRRWLEAPSSTDAECVAMFAQRFRLEGGGGGAAFGGLGRAPLWTKSVLAQLWPVLDALPPSGLEQDPERQHLLRDPGRGPGAAYYAGPGSGSQGDVLLAYRAAGRDDLYEASADARGAPAVSLPLFNATLRHEIGRAAEEAERGAPAAGASSDASVDDPGAAAEPGASVSGAAAGLSPVSIACRCGERYTAEAALGLHVSARPALRAQLLDGAVHRTFCPACGMTVMLDDLLAYTDLPRGQWLTVAPGAGLPWRRRWLAIARESFDATMVQHAPPRVAAWGREVARRLVFGLASLREKLALTAASLDDRIVELLKLQLLRDTRERLSADAYLHFVAATPRELVFERAHADGIIRTAPVPRFLYDALSRARELPALFALAFPDPLLVDARALLIAEV